MNFQQLPNGSYDYIRVGDWNNGTLIMQEDELQWPRPGGRVESVCSRPCQPGFYKVQWCNASQLVTVNFEQVFNCGFGLYLNNILPCQSSLLIYQCRSPCSLLYQFLWNLWWTKAQGRGVLQVHQFSSVSIKLRTCHIHISSSCHYDDLSNLHDIY